MLNHILLIDDDEDEHLFFQWSLESLNIQACLHDAYSADQAERVLHDLVPDIIFLDINMPVSNGFECLQRLRGLETLKNTPIYMYSTDISEYSVGRAMSLGASGCLKKSRSNTHLCKGLVDILNREPKSLAK